VLGINAAIYQSTTVARHKAGNMVLENAGGVTTVVGTDGSIVVSQGGTTLLTLPK
jgi:hypothetical protein